MIIRKFNKKGSIPNDIYRDLKRLESQYHVDENSYILFSKRTARLNKNEKIYTFHTNNDELIGYYAIDNAKNAKKILHDEEYDEEYEFYNKVIQVTKNKKISLINDLILDKNKRIYIRHIIDHIMSNNTKYIYASCNIFSFNLCKKVKSSGLIKDYIIESECDDYYEYMDLDEYDDSIGVLLIKWNRRRI